MSMKRARRSLLIDGRDEPVLDLSPPAAPVGPPEKSWPAPEAVDFQAKELSLGTPVTTDFVEQAVQALAQQHLGLQPKIQLKPDVNSVSNDLVQIKKMLHAMRGVMNPQFLPPDQLLLNPQTLTDIQQLAADEESKSGGITKDKVADALKAMKHQAHGVPLIGTPFSP